MNEQKYSSKKAMRMANKRAHLKDRTQEGSSSVKQPSYYHFVKKLHDGSYVQNTRSLLSINPLDVKYRGRQQFKHCQVRSQQNIKQSHTNGLFRTPNELWQSPSTLAQPNPFKNQDNFLKFNNNNNRQDKVHTPPPCHPQEVPNDNSRKEDNQQQNQMPRNNFRGPEMQTLNRNFKQQCTISNANMWNVDNSNNSGTSEHNTINNVSNGTGNK